MTLEFYSWAGTLILILMSLLPNIEGMGLSLIARIPGASICYWRENTDLKLRGVVI